MVVLRHLMSLLPLLQRLVVQQLTEHSMLDREHLRLKAVLAAVDVVVVDDDEDQIVELLVVVELVVLSGPK